MGGSTYGSFWVWQCHHELKAHTHSYLFRTLAAAMWSPSIPKHSALHTSSNTLFSSSFHSLFCSSSTRKSSSMSAELNCRFLPWVNFETKSLWAVTEQSACEEVTFPSWTVTLLSINVWSWVSVAQLTRGDGSLCERDDDEMAPRILSHIWRHCLCWGISSRTWAASRQTVSRSGSWTFTCWPFVESQYFVFWGKNDKKHFRVI